LKQSLAEKRLAVTQKKFGLEKEEKVAKFVICVLF
jgi:hypothetical protein